jgi:hypothetical protein
MELPVIQKTFRQDSFYTNEKGRLREEAGCDRIRKEQFWKQTVFWLQRKIGEYQ